MKKKLTLIRQFLCDAKLSLEFKHVGAIVFKSTPFSVNQSITWATCVSISLIKTKVTIRKVVCTKRNKMPMAKTKILKLQHLKGPK